MRKLIIILLMMGGCATKPPPKSPEYYLWADSVNEEWMRRQGRLPYYDGGRGGCGSRGGPGYRLPNGQCAGW